MTINVTKSVAADGTRSVQIDVCGTDGVQGGVDMSLADFRSDRALRKCLNVLDAHGLPRLTVEWIRGLDE